LICPFHAIYHSLERSRNSGEKPLAKGKKRGMESREFIIGYKKEEFI